MENPPPLGEWRSIVAVVFVHVIQYNERDPIVFVEAKQAKRGQHCKLDASFSECEYVVVKRLINVVVF